MTTKYVHEIRQEMTGDDMLNMLETLIFLQESFKWETDLTDERTRTEWIYAIFKGIEDLQKEHEAFQSMEYTDILKSDLGYSLALKLGVSQGVMTGTKAIDYIIDYEETSQGELLQSLWNKG